MSTKPEDLKERFEAQLTSAQNFDKRLEEILKKNYYFVGGPGSAESDLQELLRPRYDPHWQVGVMYETGQGVNQSDEKAFEWYEKSIQYERTLIKDSKKVNYFYPRKWSAKFDLTLTREHYLAAFYESDRRGSKKDPARARTLYQSNFENWIAYIATTIDRDKEEYFAYWIGYYYSNGFGVLQNHAKAFEWYKESAERGYAKAKFALGDMHANGHHGEKSSKKAFEYYEQAATGKDPDAQFTLGMIYVNDTGVIKDEKKGFDLIKLSAEQGNLQAQIMLAKMYANGQGVDKSSAESLKWLGLAFKQDNGEASIQKLCSEIKQENATIQVLIAVLYAQGEGVKQDNAKSFEWVERSGGSNENQLSLINAMGWRYELGSYNFPQNLECAKKCYQLADKKGYFLATFNCGILEEQQNNPSGAEAYYKKATAQKGELSACYVNWEKQISTEKNMAIKTALLFRLGIAYAKGLDVPEDKEKAMGYFKQAAAEKHEPSQKQLETLLNKSKPTTSPEVSTPISPPAKTEEVKSAAESATTTLAPRSDGLTPAGQQQISGVTALVQSQTEQLELLKRQLQHENNLRTGEAEKAKQMQREMEEMKAFMIAFKASQTQAVVASSTRKEGEQPGNK